MRPTRLEDYIGQEHIVGERGILRKAVAAGVLPSFVLWGPPGTGKTTLARIIASSLDRPFYALSAIHSGVKEVREVIEKAKNDRFFNSQRPILFIDEIHRFSKSQQDSLLGAVEQGVVTLIGATTENPSFEVIPALLSRCQVYVLTSLGADALQRMLDRAIAEDEVLRKQTIKIVEYEALFRYSGGDARKLLNLLELCVGAIDAEVKTIDNEVVIAIIQQNIALYDKTGEQHYDIISAFIKSVRGSDPDAALYWLARMIEGGEDVLFIARRLIILAAEDVGLANPNALLIANACFDAVHRIGYPEARIVLSEATIYLATSAKSNAAYLAIDKAIEIVRKTGNLAVPLHLRNAPTALMKQLNYGKDYQYAHNFGGNFVKQDYLPSELRGEIIYTPQNNPQENGIKGRLEQWWKRQYDKS
jgi:putative ATPase